MANEAPSVLFLGDLGDPWVVAIADALPGQVTRLDCPGDLPETMPMAEIVVIHRAILAAPDGEALRTLRERGSRIILCIGPHVRARDVERFATPADLVLTEATVSETIARHVIAPPSVTTHELLPLVAVVASGFEVRRMLVQAVEGAGYSARPFASWDDATPSRLAVWDAPVLEPGWARPLREASKRRSVVAMIGFADRELVTMAREAGAAACLDLPCDIADLAFVLEKLAARPEWPVEFDGPHTVPPRRMGLRVVRPPVADPRRGA